jgi:tight adherence protein B
MQNGLFPLIYVLAFLAVVIIVQTGTGVFIGARDKQRQVNRRLTMLHSGMRPEAVYSALVKRAPANAPSDARLLGLYERLWAFCQQGGPGLSPARLLASVGASTAALWFLSLIFMNANTGGGFFLNALLSLIGAAVLSCAGAYLWVNRLRTNRLKKLEEQLPLALDVVVRAIRAGHPVVAAVQLAAEELGDPIGSEFGLIVDEYTYGSDLKAALLNFARRTGSSDAHFFAVSVGIQAETGGNLALILEGLASVIRARRALTKKVRALSSEGRASAMVLTALPVFLVSFLMLTQPHYYIDKFSDPLFWTITTAVLSIYVVGWLIINRIINFKY